MQEKLAIFFYRYIAPLEQRDFSEVGFSSSRQRRDISIGVDGSDKGTPAECYVLDPSDMVTLPEYLHTHEWLRTLGYLVFHFPIDFALPGPVGSIS